ncbi:MAG TPA: DEAD/DEAH box helicase [Actinomycetes bacterium]|jgi:ATP-dependent RNA helicase HelY|nr:DEAD/DEAH box helicase [Actinomycetes bacterium]
MATPAQRYADARRRQTFDDSPLGSFAPLYPFGLDPFQVRACEALQAGTGVLVAAPTGAGKTVVGEFAVHLALAEGRKCFYTTPIKALSNQKYADLVARYGAEQVGLLTGDNSVNGEAPVVVMTTEVLRNMLYAGSSTLDGLGYVVMDEVHYLSDRFRGAVWEEVIIHLPEPVRLVSLSATVSNAEEFGDWLGTVRGPTEVVVEEHRPVPLWQHVMADRRLYDLWVGDDGARVNPELVRLSREQDRFARSHHQRPGRGGHRPRGVQTPSRVQVLERLDAEGLLPAITFIFSRAGCDAAVRQCLHAGLRLLGPEERDEVRRVVEARCADIPDEDLRVLGYHEFLAGLEHGVAAHHAGMLPTFKEVVEQLFVRGLVKAVFATETLALGINMPARSVVLERLVKWNGETHADVTPGEYTQLTGRAGRRGIDVEGHAVVVWSPGLEPAALGGLASTRTYPLRSSFRPSYNMAVNLVGQVGRDTARVLLQSSFAQFQADRAVVGLSREVARNEEALEGYREAMTCHLGDFAEYAGLRQAISAREASLARAGAADQRAQAAASLEALRPGDVIEVPAGRRGGLAVVLDPGTASGPADPRPMVLTAARQVRRLSLQDFPVPVEALQRLRIPKAFNPRSPASRRDLAATLRNTGLEDRPRGRSGRARSAAADDTELVSLRARLRTHPCHGCAEREDHARWAERYHRLARETEQLSRRVRDRTHTISRTFDRICGLLEELGYLHGDEVTGSGRVLGTLYTELDLLAADCLLGGAWDGLGPADLAAVVSALVYESRRDEDTGPPRLPAGRAREVLEDTQRRWAALEARERAHRVPPPREPDPRFAWVTHQWASGRPLDAVLRDADNGQLAPGDFVRWTKQVVDLLGQVGDTGRAPGAGPAVVRVAATARTAADLLRRGVVAYSSVG